MTDNPSRPSRVFAEGDNLHPLQTAFVEHDGFQCGYCTSGQICSAIGMLAESRTGMPSYVTDDLTQPQPELTDNRNPRTDERQHLPLRSLPEHCGSHQTSRADADMKAFTYQRARPQTAHAGRRGHQAWRQDHCRRHQSARPDEIAGRDAIATGRYQPATARQDRRNPRRRPTGRRAGSK